MSDHFGVDFGELSLVDLIVDDDVRNLLREAELKIKDHNFGEAANELAKAKTLVFNMMQKIIPQVDKKLKEFDSVLSQLNGFRGVNAFGYLTEYLGVLREASLIALFQLPLEDHAALRAVLPSAVQSHSGKWYITSRRSDYTGDECRRALSSIISICQKLELRN